MRCPFCHCEDTHVKDSRPSEDNASIRRRRSCPTCEARFTTFERVQIRELFVLKKNGERKPFDRDKVTRSIQLAVRKRPVTAEAIEMIVNKVICNLESMGENDIPSGFIGKCVMEVLAKVDLVAYVRFASVYKDFREAKDFAVLVKELEEVFHGSPQ